jgi:hypothetical protein
MGAIKEDVVKSITAYVVLLIYIILREGQHAKPKNRTLASKNRQRKI